MSGYVLTVPIAASGVETWRRICQELSGSRRRHYEASRRRLGITRERFALVENSFGAIAVAMLEADDVDLALAGIISSDRPFESWFRERLQELHGARLTRYEPDTQAMPPNPPDELLFEWTLPAYNASP
jgi:hypothetical protein